MVEGRQVVAAFDRGDATEAVARCAADGGVRFGGQFAGRAQAQVEDTSRRWWRSAVFGASSAHMGSVSSRGCRRWSSIGALWVVDIEAGAWYRQAVVPPQLISGRGQSPDQGPPCGGGGGLRTDGTQLDRGCGAALPGGRSRIRLGASARPQSLSTAPSGTRPVSR